MRAQRVVITLFEGVQSLDVAGPLEVLDGGNTWQAETGGEPAYEITTASVDGRPVRTSSGLMLMPDADLRDVAACDLLLVPGGTGTAVPEAELVDWVRHTAPRVRRVVSVCSGAFLLAAAGVLAGRRATTHWAYCDALAERFPEVAVVRDPIFVRDGNVATSAGVTAGIDLALALVEEDLGRQAALMIARYLVVFLRRPGGQAQFSAQLSTQTAQRAPLREVQQWISEHPGADLSVPELARRANLSPRQFARAFVAEVGMSPGRYVDRTRLEAARRRLEDTGDSVEHTAVACGFGTAEAMRRAFVRTLGASPAEYRRRFRPGSIPAVEDRDEDRDRVV